MYSIRNRPVRVASLPVQARKPWGGLGTSVAFHTAIIAVVVGVLNHKKEEALDPLANSPIAVPVQMVYLPQAARPVPTPQAQRPAPDAVHAPTPEEALSADPDRDLAPQMTREEPEVSPPERREPEPDPTLARRPPEPEPDRNETLEEQSQRLFGRPLLQRPQERSQLGIRLGRDADQDRAERTTCTPKPRDPHAPREMAELIGRVYNENSRPLAGAFLQIIGTSYSTYSDRSGLYRLVFDASLVDACRTQYVRVVANGYRGRNLVLGVGPGVNDVVLGH